MISYSQSLKSKNEISVSAVEEVSDLVKFNAHIH